MPIAALFIIMKTWEQPRYSSIDEWKKKLCYTHTIKTDGLLVHATTQLNILFVLSEGNQTLKPVYSMITFLITFWSKKNYRDTNQIHGCHMAGSKEK